ncbi:orotate phosphoribosyltransferase [candidate division KSB1 bacterium]|nr:orotate phosphoribosyltransferase [candidate division KSB1 bacterium]
MEHDDVLELFRKSGAFLEGHFLLTSGLHSPHYFQCAKVLQYPNSAQKLCWEIANHYMTKKISVVIGPAIGGIVVAQEVARLINARAIFAERQDGKMTLRRGFELLPEDRVLVVEDVVTTGGSIKEVIDLVKESSASLQGVGFIVDRTQGKVQFDCPSFSLLKMDVITFSSQECPLCNQNLPLVKPGSRKLPVTS